MAELRQWAPTLDQLQLHDVNGRTTLVQVDDFAPQIDPFVFIVPDGVVDINHMPFGTAEHPRNQMMKGIILPPSFRKFGFGSMENSHLHTLHIPAQCNEIKANAFQESLSLHTVTFDEDCQINTIEHNSFYNCLTLARVRLPRLLRRIGTRAFHGCRQLTVVHPADKPLEKDTFKFPATVSWIGAEAFYETMGVHIRIFTEETTCRNNAFERCYALKTVALSGVKSLGNNAFRHCANLRIMFLSAHINPEQLYGAFGEFDHPSCPLILYTACQPNQLVPVMEGPFRELPILHFADSVDLGAPTEMAHPMALISKANMQRTGEQRSNWMESDSTDLYSLYNAAMIDDRSIAADIVKLFIFNHREAARPPPMFWDMAMTRILDVLDKSLSLCMHCGKEATVYCERCDLTFCSDAENRKQCKGSVNKIQAHSEQLGETIPYWNARFPKGAHLYKPIELYYERKRPMQTRFLMPVQIKEKMAGLTMIPMDTWTSIMRKII